MIRNYCEAPECRKESNVVNLFEDKWYCLRCITILAKKRLTKYLYDLLLKQNEIKLRLPE